MGYFKIKKLKEHAIIPSKRHEDAGYDLYGIFQEDFEIMTPGDIKLVSTGIAIEIPNDKVFFICERSSTGSKGIARRSGVIDSGYRGEILVALNNTSNKTIVFYKNDNEDLDNFLSKKLLNKDSVILYPQAKAIAQGIILSAYHYDVEVVENLTDSQRGEGGFGSSNK